MRRSLDQVTLDLLVEDANSAIESLPEHQRQLEREKLTEALSLLSPDANGTFSPEIVDRFVYAALKRSGKYHVENDKDTGKPKFTALEIGHVVRTAVAEKLAVLLRVDTSQNESA